MAASFRHLVFKAMFVSACILDRVQGHMIMANPVPYSHATIDNSPLTSSNYPCKLTGDASTFYSATGIDNTYAAGSTQTLSFKGSATHGGGSCQLAVSSDMQPSVSTDWRVILSIEGGCPTTDLTGSSGASTYNWTVPESLTPGEYSFAWTWISKEAGQAEFYMNCAPITVTAASTKRNSAMARRNDIEYPEYPELFVANLADINSCETVEGSDYVYPYGGIVQNLGVPAASLKYTTITSSSCVPKGQTQGGDYLPTAGVTGGSGSGNATATSSASVASTSATSTASGGTTLVTSISSAQPSASETVYVSPVVQSTQTKSQFSSSAATSAVTSSTQATVSSSELSSSSVISSASALTTAPTNASSSASSAGATATGSGSSSGSMSGSCTDEGEFNCIGSNYQQCASGAWTAMQALPAGTTCTQGLSTGLWARHLRRSLGPDGFAKVWKGRRNGFAREARTQAAVRG